MMNFCGVKCYDAEVYFDTSNGEGGWLVVQRRKDNSFDFNRGWGEYEDGLGSWSHRWVLVRAEGPPLSHWLGWLGNENRHQDS